MRANILSLPDHLPNPYTGKYNETQAGRMEWLIEMGVEAEKAGFWGYWIGEHHGYYMFIASPVVPLAAIAVKTSRIKLGPGIILLPNCDPIRLAEDYAELDLISKGRAVVGFGTGITKSTYALFNQDVNTAFPTSMEKLDVILKLWSERKVSIPAGKHFHAINNFTCEPRTFTEKPLLTFRAVANEDSAEDAGRRGQRLSILTVVGDFKSNRKLAEIYKEAYAKAGHDPKERSIGVNVFAYAVPENGDKGRKHWKPYIENYGKASLQLIAEQAGTRSISEQARAATPDAGMRQCEMVGTPDEILDMMAKAYDDIGGFDEINCIVDAGGIPREECLASVRCLGEGVLPRLHEIAGKSVHVAA